MYTRLGFFGNSQESISGTNRGLIAMGALLILSTMWYRVLFQSYYSKYRDDNVFILKRYIGYFLAATLLVSAVSVQLPLSVKEAATYGALVGFVVYGFVNGVNLAINNKWNYGIAILDTAWGVVSTMILSIILYFIFF